jgi:hypothetical protein
VPFNSDILNPTAITHSKLAIPPAKVRKSPYNTRPPKKPSLPPPEENLSLDSISSVTPPPPQTTRKRPNLSEMVSSSKKGPTIPHVSDHFSEENTSIIPTYNHGLFDKAPAIAFFKAARKEKEKKKKKKKDSISYCNYCF